MKHASLTIVIITIMSIGTKAQAEFPTVIKINPLSLAFGNFNLSYQRAFSDASAFQIGANYWNNLLGTKVGGYGARGAYQFFISNKAISAPEGFYIGPQVSMNMVNVQETDEKVTTYGVGIMLGYQWI